MHSALTIKALFVAHQSVAVTDAARHVLPLGANCGVHVNPDSLFLGMPAVIVAIILHDATNCALSDDRVTVTNKSNFNIVMNVVAVITNDAISDNVSIITETVTVAIPEIVATAVHTVPTPAG